MLISVGWVPPYLCPSRRLLRSRVEDRGLVTRPKIAPIPGPHLRRWLEFLIDIVAGQFQSLCRYAASGTARAIAQAKAAISRAMATTTWLACLPRAISCRERVPRPR